jgi:hypothetical protein
LFPSTNSDDSSTAFLKRRIDATPVVDQQAQVVDHLVTKFRRNLWDNFAKPLFVLLIKELFNSNETEAKLRISKDDHFDHLCLFASMGKLVTAHQAAKGSPEQLQFPDQISVRYGDSETETVSFSVVELAAEVKALFAFIISSDEYQYVLNVSDVNRSLEEMSVDLLPLVSTRLLLLSKESRDFNVDMNSQILKEVYDSVFGADSAMKKSGPPPADDNKRGKKRHADSQPAEQLTIRDEIKGNYPFIFLIGKLAEDPFFAGNEPVDDEYKGIDDPKKLLQQEITSRKRRISAKFQTVVHLLDYGHDGKRFLEHVREWLVRESLYLFVTELQ